MKIAYIVRKIAGWKQSGILYLVEKGQNGGVLYEKHTFERLVCGG